MRIKLTPVVAGLCLLGVVSTPAFAATDAAAPNEDQLIEKLSQQTAALQKQVSQLQKQVRYLKSHQPATPEVQNANTESNANVTGGDIPGQSVHGNLATNKAATSGLVAPKPSVVGRVGDEPLYITGSPIVTAPFLGERSAFDASDLIISYPSIGTDLLLLQQRQKIYNVYQQSGLPLPTDPIVDLSGGVEAQVLGQKPYSGAKTTDADLTRAEIDVGANINTWATGYMAIVYDDLPPADGVGPRVSNSNIYLDKGFITIGNLSRTPFYSTIGQIYVPFGRYSSYMLTSPLTKDLGRLQERAVVLGYDQNYGTTELSASTFAFNGDSYTSNPNKIDNPGADIQYKFNGDSWNWSLGASYINNIADSLGMQANGATTGFGGFGETGGNEQLQHAIPAYDLRGSVGFGHFSLLGEYVNTFHEFSQQDLTFNNHGAQPSALDVEAAYNFPVFDKPSSIAVGYGMSKEALALLIPQKRYITAFNISVWKDTVETIEYRHDMNYGGSTATGSGNTVTTSGLGNSSDTVTLQIGVYF